MTFVRNHRLTVPYFSSVLGEVGESLRTTPNFNAWMTTDGFAFSGSLIKRTNTK